MGLEMDGLQAQLICAFILGAQSQGMRTDLNKWEKDDMEQINTLFCLMGGIVSLKHLYDYEKGKIVDAIQDRGSGGIGTVTQILTKARRNRI